MVWFIGMYVYSQSSWHVGVKGHSEGLYVCTRDLSSGLVSSK